MNTQVCVCSKIKFIKYCQINSVNFLRNMYMVLVGFRVGRKGISKTDLCMKNLKSENTCSSIIATSRSGEKVYGGKSNGYSRKLPGCRRWPIFLRVTFQCTDVLRCTYIHISLPNTTSNLNSHKVGLTDSKLSRVSTWKLNSPGFLSVEAFLPDCHRCCLK